MKIPFYKRFQPEIQLEILEDALMRNHLASGGAYTKLLQEHFQMENQEEHILLVTSASSALELALLAINPEPGDEYIIPSYNFPSAANAVLRAGGVPVLCDTDPVTKNICLKDAASKINKKTQGIIPTHYAGISCNLHQLQALCCSSGLFLIEDAAQGVGSTFQGRALGSIGDFGAYSFHHTKNFSCGEGGAFLCREKEWMEKAEMLMDNGMDRFKYVKRQEKSYSWQLLGANLVLSELSAALLYTQILHEQEIIDKRKKVHDYYHQVFTGEKMEEKGVRLMEIPPWAGPNYHIYYVDCETKELREKLRLGLLEDGIDARAHYVPLHASGRGREMGLKDVDFPGSVQIADRILRLPIHTELTLRDLEYVTDKLRQRVNGK